VRHARVGAVADHHPRAGQPGGPHPLDACAGGLEKLRALDGERPGAVPGDPREDPAARRIDQARLLPGQPIALAEDEGCLCADRGRADRQLGHRSWVEPIEAQTAERGAIELLIAQVPRAYRRVAGQ
jgi:hypothetical protein